jgi:hypothetical protein
VPRGAMSHFEVPKGYMELQHDFLQSGTDADRPREHVRRS